MTGPALTAAVGGARRAARSRSPQLRMMAGLARIEAVLMVRSVLVLSGLVAGILLIGSSYWPGQVQPLWWEADWRIGAGLLVIAMTVLARAQLAAGRAHRDRMTDLYASFPASASTRTIAQLAGLAGAVPASLLLIGAGALTVQLEHPIGSPAIMVLAAGLVLVIAAGAAGIAIGTRFPHPLAGLFGALALFLPTATGHLIPGGVIWLIPWQLYDDQLGWLPGPLTGYPPAGAHALLLGGVAVLAAIVALVLTVRRRWARGWLAAAGVVAVAVICVAAAVQLAPVPTTQLNHLVAEMSDPGSAQQCSTVNGARYCLYPGFGRDRSMLEAPVNQVLALLPERPGQQLTVQQVLWTDFADDLAGDSLTRGHSAQQIAQWQAQTRYAPGADVATAKIYLAVGEWPAFGGSVADADFSVAMGVAQWAVGLPLTSQSIPCTPVNQAREAIAIWLTIEATHPSAGELQQGLGGPGIGYPSADVDGSVIPEWVYPGLGAGGVKSSGPFALTAVGYLLAKEMTSLPERRVSQVLKADWATWVNWHTTDTQLAAALGIPVPIVTAPAGPKQGGRMLAPVGSLPQSSVCTA